MDTNSDVIEPDVKAVRAADSVVRGLIPVILVLALGGIGVGVLALLTTPSTSRTDHEVRVLTRELAHARTQIAALKAASTKAANRGNVASLQTDVGDLQTTVAGLQSKVHQYGICVPELMTYVTDLTASYSWVSDGNGDRLVTDPVTISSGSQISSNCTKMLYGG